MGWGLARFFEILWLQGGGKSIAFLHTEMAPKRKKVGFQPSSAFEQIVPEIEDEIVEEYAQQLGDDSDLYLLK